MTDTNTSTGEMPENPPEIDGRCPNCGEDEIDGSRCYYCGWHDYNCGICDKCADALLAQREKNDG